MLILINKDMKVIMQGIIGKIGQFYMCVCCEYVNGCEVFVVGVNLKKVGEDFEGILIYVSVKEVKVEIGVIVLVIYVLLVGVVVVIWEVVEVDLDFVICIMEGIFVCDMIEVKDCMCCEGCKMLLFGLNCLGMIMLDELKIGIMLGYIYCKGCIGVVLCLGMLMYEVVVQLMVLGFGQLLVVGIGGDLINGLKYIDVMKMFNDDLDMDVVVMIGEIGGLDEVNVVEWIKDNMKKLVVGFIVGVMVFLGKCMGYVGVLILGGVDMVEVKLEIMEVCGIIVMCNLLEMGCLLKKVL